MLRTLWNSGRLFVPLLAGASLRDRVTASIGALIGIGLVGLTCVAVLPSSMPWIVAPMGASAVLLFAVPASPLAQPWSIMGGNVISAVVGAIAAWICPDPVTAAAVAVSFAILTMSLLRCLHPPGSAQRRAWRVRSVFSASVRFPDCRTDQFGVDGRDRLGVPLSFGP